MIYYSTGLRIASGHNDSLLRSLQGMKMQIFEGSVPANADALADTTKLLVTISDNKQTATVAEVMIATVTAIIGITYTLEINGVIIEYTADSGDTDASICQAFADVIDVVTSLNLNTSVGASTLTLTAATAGEYFSVNTSCDDSTDAFTNAESVANAYGLLFEAVAGSAVIKKLVSQTWAGTVVKTGNPTFFRLVELDDDGAASTTRKRVQGSVSISGAELNLDRARMYVGQEQPIGDEVYINLLASV